MEFETKDEKVIAGRFNDHFINIDPTLATKFMDGSTSFDSFLNSSSTLSIGITETSPKEVTDISSQLRLSSSSRIDGIDRKIARNTIGCNCSASVLCN